MNLRYYIEFLVFLLLLIYFQYNLDKFNKDLHALRCDHENIRQLEAILPQSQPGTIFSDFNSFHECRSDQFAEFVNHSQEEVLESLRTDMAHEIDLAVTELDNGMYVAMISFSFPLQIISQCIYAKLTKRVYRFRMLNAIDLIIFILVCVWFERFEVYMHTDNDGFSLEDPPTLYQKFMKSVHDDIESGTFHFDYLMAAVDGMMWFRLLFMLELN